MNNTPPKWNIMKLDTPENQVKNFHLSEINELGLLIKGTREHQGDSVIVLIYIFTSTENV
jgi:hypothetical protein